MTGLLAGALVFALTLAGFAALALAIDRHHQQVCGRAALRRRRRAALRAAGVLGLGLALAGSVALAGAATGIVLWTGLLSAAALALILVLSYRPQWLRCPGVAPPAGRSERAHRL